MQTDTMIFRCIDGKTLVIGTTLLIAVYTSLGPRGVFFKDYIDFSFKILFVVWPILEAVLFTFIVLLSHKTKKIWQWIVASVVAAVMNYFFNHPSILLSFLAAPMFFLLEVVQWPPIIERILRYGWLSSITAISYCMLLHFVLRHSYFSRLIYFKLAVVLSFAGLPLAIGHYLSFDNAYIVHNAFWTMHKALWWILFGWVIWSSSTIPAQLDKNKSEIIAIEEDNS